MRTHATVIGASFRGVCGVSVARWRQSWYHAGATCALAHVLVVGSRAAVACNEGDFDRVFGVETLPWGVWVLGDALRDVGSQMGTSHCTFRCFSRTRLLWMLDETAETVPCARVELYHRVFGVGTLIGDLDGP
jgi:hypothetical protein